MAPPSTVAKKPASRQKTKGEVETEGMDTMQLRIDDYPWGQETPTVAGVDSAMDKQKKSEGMKSTNTIQSISKPDV